MKNISTATKKMKNLLAGREGSIYNLAGKCCVVLPLGPAQSKVVSAPFFYVLLSQ